MGATPSKKSKKKLAKHDVYDAKSRAVTFPLCSSLAGQPDFLARPIQRRGLGVSKVPRSFILSNFMTPEECSYLIEQTEAVGYLEHSDLRDEYPASYRNNQRLIYISDELAGSLWKRLLPHLTEADIQGVTPYGYGTTGIWIPRCLNDGFIFNKYAEGEWFKGHVDGLYIDPKRRCSIFTVLIYLNDNFAGGHLAFKEPKEALGKKDEILDLTKDDVVKALNQKVEEISSTAETLGSYIPSRGEALIFPGDVFHEANLVRQGTKYVVRTNIMFECVSQYSNAKELKEDKAHKEIYKLFSTFDYLSSVGDVEKFTVSFLRAQQLQLAKSKCVHPPPTRTFLADIFRYIFSYFSPQQVLRLASVSKGWFEAVRDEQLWMNFFKQKWPILFEAEKEITKFDWIGVYQKRCLANTYNPVISGRNITYISSHGLIKTMLGRVDKMSGMWDYSFHINPTGTAWSENTVIDADIWGYLLACTRNYDTTGAQVHVVFPADFHDCDGGPIHEQFCRVPKAHVEDTAYYTNRPRAYYVEASIVALYHFRLANALCLCFYSERNSYELTSMEHGVIQHPKENLIAVPAKSKKRAAFQELFTQIQKKSTLPK